MLKPHDIVVVLKLLECRGKDAAPTFAALAAALQLSPSEVHAAVGRALAAGLLRRPLADTTRSMPLPVSTALAEFLIHGLKYVWPVSRGAVTRGVATGTSAPAVANALHTPIPNMPLVWPDAEGDVRGESLKPLYPHAAKVAKKDAFLHEWLALLDLVRLRSGREATLAAEIIQDRLS